MVSGRRLWQRVLSLALPPVRRADANDDIPLIFDDAYQPKPAALVLREALASGTPRADAPTQEPPERAPAE